MATDLSKSAFEVFAGKRRTRWLPTLIIAALVTSAVAIPLVVRAIDARNNPVEREVVLAPADAQRILVDTAAIDPSPLDQATVSGDILVSMRDESASSVSFNLYAAGSDQAIVASQDLQGPQFDLIVSDSGGGEPFDSSLLANGTYELFVTVRLPNEDQRAAVSFEVQNP